MFDPIRLVPVRAQLACAMVLAAIAAGCPQQGPGIQFAPISQGDDGDGGAAGEAPVEPDDDDGAAATAGSGGAPGTGGEGGVAQPALACALPDCSEQLGEGECDAACSVVYACGLLGCDEPGQLCPGFGPDAGAGQFGMDEFLTACLEQCALNPVLPQLVNGCACDETIATLESVSPEFAKLCSEGAVDLGSNGDGA